PAGSTTLAAPTRALASWMAARSVHAPSALAHTPSPGDASTASAVLLTVKRAVVAVGVGVTVAVGEGVGENVGAPGAKVFVGVSLQVAVAVGFDVEVTVNVGLTVGSAGPSAMRPIRGAYSLNHKLPSGPTVI